MEYDEMLSFMFFRIVDVVLLLALHLLFTWLLVTYQY